MIWVSREEMRKSTWCGVAWHDRMWHHVTWYDVTWCGIVWHGMVWHGMVWHDGVSFIYLCIVHSMVHSRAVLSRHQISCTSISGDCPLLSFSRVCFIQMAEIPNTHIHVHHTQAYKTPYPGTPMIYFSHDIAWHGMTWHDMAWHEFAGENRKDSTLSVIFSEWLLNSMEMLSN